MGQFFRPPGNDRIWFYSERGLLAYLFHAVLEGDLSLVLDNAMDGTGRKLREVVGPVGLHRVLTEFSLGNTGFGNPDGAILTALGQPNTSFVFVEGKPVKFWKSFRKPEPSDSIQAKLAEADGRRLVRRLVRDYNSKLNGQLELRWRFVNALRASAGQGEINERHVTLRPEVLANDVFYWRHHFQPDPGKREQWRRVSLAEDLAGLRQSLGAVREFYLLAITTDSTFPQQEMSQVRLFDGTGQPLADAGNRLFWMSLDRVKERLERCGSDGCWLRLVNSQWSKVP
ncbi:hypothetical protein [Thermogemmata fonticola]|uniref:Uncharacterized protein n=1 Tax=Thermogemmata fonticola TaxID=2755323 RepID=A0A7V9AA34_9BACT|nr:hypothetical protein [Thermogemmata fonticola]MBA2224691.1 hypothetical protein [Thermogemmata fonticola]